MRLTRHASSPRVHTLAPSMIRLRIRFLLYGWLVSGMVSGKLLRITRYLISGMNQRPSPCVCLTTYRHGGVSGGGGAAAYAADGQAMTASVVMLSMRATVGMMDLDYGVVGGRTNARARAPLRRQARMNAGSRGLA